MNVLSRLSRANWSGFVAASLVVTTGALPFYGCLGSEGAPYEAQSSGLSAAFTVTSGATSHSELGVDRWDFRLDALDSPHPVGVYGAYDEAGTLLFEIAESVDDVGTGATSWWIDGQPVSTDSQREELVRLVSYAQTDLGEQGVDVPYRGDCSSELWNFLAADAALGAAMLSLVACATLIGCAAAVAGLASAAGWLKSAGTALDACVAEPSVLAD